MNNKINFIGIATLFSLAILSTTAQSNPVACFKGNVGNFCIELFQGYTPITTTNFIHYINEGAYTNGIIHRSGENFVIQGGRFKLTTDATGTFSGLSFVATSAPIINEYKISNTRGTVAMAKLPDKPNSATSQWFVNMKDNSENLNKQNGGFTVFGRVIFGGMTTFDAIELMPTYAHPDINFGLTNIPLIDLDGTPLQASNFVHMTEVSVTDVAGVFDEDVLSLSVDIGSDTLLDVKLKLIETTPNYVFQLDDTSIQSLAAKPTTVASYSFDTGELAIPSVMLNANTVVHNVTMQLTNAELYQFTLKSYE